METKNIFKNSNQSRFRCAFVLVDLWVCNFRLCTIHFFSSEKMLKYLRFTDAEFVNCILNLQVRMQNLPNIYSENTNFKT